MTREQIDKICTWMGWKKHFWDDDIWEWRNDLQKSRNKRIGDYAADCTFDPSANPSDCARVMDEVDRKGLWTVIKREDARCFVDIANPEIEQDWYGYGGTRWEAFCLALLAMIEGRA